MVYFHKEDTNYRVQGIRVIKSVLSQLIDNQGYTINCVNIIICSDPYLLNINRTYLDHDYYTDIITFDNSEKHGYIDADLFISIDTVKSNAKLFGTTTLQELRRVIIHGVLHLVGFNDKTESQKNEMRLKEDEYLAYFCS